jgi:hypothetical protein
MAEVQQSAGKEHGATHGPPYALLSGLFHPAAIDHGSKCATHRIRLRAAPRTVEVTQKTSNGRDLWNAGSCL